MGSGDYGFGAFFQEHWPTPMSSERLAEIQRLSYHQQKYTAGEMGSTDALDIDVALRDLLADNERLRAENGELRRMASSLPVQYAAFQQRHGEKGGGGDGQR